MKETVRGIEAMQAYAGRFVSALRPHKDAVVVGLTGDLGAGKTTFVQGVAKALGIAEPITSPTFVIEKVYMLTGQRFSHLIHVDAYRLKSAHELEVLEFQELLHDPQNLIFIEWPENVAEAMPQDIITLKFHFVDEHTREVSPI